MFWSMYIRNVYMEIPVEGRGRDSYYLFDGHDLSVLRNVSYRYGMRMTTNSRHFKLFPDNRREFRYL